MPTRKFLTFDLGTTLYKVALFDEDGELIAIERVTPPIQHPKPNCSELHSGEFLVALSDAAHKLKARLGGRWDDLAAVSFATQANSFILLGDSGMANFILWPDQRATSITDQLNGVSSLPRFRQRTGLPRFSPLLGLVKLRWLLENDPELMNQRTDFYFISDFLTLELSGRYVSEAGVAGLSGALDIQTLRWCDDVLRQLNVPSSISLPEVERAGTDLGQLDFGGSHAFGLPLHCRFVVGCLDQYAGAIGTGTVEPGMICETTGTVLAAVRCDDRLRDDLPDDVFQGPGFDADRFFQMSFSSTSANLLEWYRNQLPNKPSFEELTRLAEAAPPSDLLIEPYNDRGPIESVFRHVRPEHAPGQVVRAIMQRVAESLKEQVQRLCGDTPPKEIRSAGGAARNDFWLQMKADALGIPFVAMECEEPTSLGAAMLAARAMALGTLPQIADRWVRIRKRFEPRGA